MKKLMFIRPPFEGMGQYKPIHLGIAMLSSYIKKNFGNYFDYYFVDALLDTLSVYEVFKKIIEVKPDIIAITIKSVQVEQSIELIRMAKKEYSPIIICGGNHVSVEPNIFIKSGADFSIIGEGEEAIVKIIKYLYFNGEHVESLSNIVVNEDDNYKREKIIISEDINKYGIPDWSIMDVKRYNENIHINKSIPALPVMASRGCPYKCDFCSSHLTWGARVRYREPELVLKEIKRNIEIYNINNIHFYDDNLMLNEKWLEKFLDLVEREKVKFKWICLSRPEIIIKSSHLLNRMKNCGCQGFELGFETSDGELYKIMNKKNEKTDFIKVYELLIKYDFPMIEFLIMCFYEGETFNSLFQTYIELKKYKKDKPIIVSSRYFATPFKNTEFYNNIDKKGVLLDKSYKYKYAIFLNFMPFSFLNSTFENYKVNPKVLKIQLAFLDIENIIHKQDFDYINSLISEEDFSIIFNKVSSDKGTVLDLVKVIKKKITKQIPVESIYEYIGRMIEFAISTGAVKHI